ncbi:PREDICTED: disks large-associated protein 5-like [Ceratotherium simum simum]|uniref:Disks large-associated protein 5-like n=1 Tax=Ceratotherium simum simum TaxID=73337 RepID=A0ABM1CJI8_CERSS|nr:PREDICTED: disks large-associated protein 5-like [Ceratotherium simum simum]
MDENGVLSKMEKLLKTNTAKMKGKQSFAPEAFVFHPPDDLKTYRLTPVTPRKYVLNRNETATKNVDGLPIKEVLSLEVNEDQKSQSQHNVLYFRIVHLFLALDNSRCGAVLCSVGCFVASQASSTPLVRDNHKCSRRCQMSPGGKIDQCGEPLPLDKQSLITRIWEALTRGRFITAWLATKVLFGSLTFKNLIFPLAKGLIRIAVGQTRLLMKERFKQFEGLVDDCEYKRSEKDTTCADLDGFWDMVRFQIQDIHQKFNNLTKLEECGWENDNNTSKKVFQKQVVSGIASKPKQDDGGRMAARNRLAAVKKAMRERGQRKEQAEAAASAAPKEVDQIVFDAGFFRIKSPVKSFSVVGNNLTTECHLLDSVSFPT